MKAGMLRREDEDRVVAAIEEAETRCSAELRIHLQRTCKGSALDEAASWFEDLGMDQTKDRNGVLIFVAWKSRTFAVVGDEGISEETGARLWPGVTEILSTAFAEEAYAEGLCNAVTHLGAGLAAVFPPSTDDVNSLPDDIHT